MNLRYRGTVAHIIIAIRMNLSLSGAERKSDNRMHMNMKTKPSSVIVILWLACFSASHSSQAVSPPPDGDYPGGNTAEGHNALLSLTTGTYNTAVGWFSLQSNLTGNFNTAIGAGTLISNAADANTATGAGALLNNTSGTNNTAAGVFALFDNTTGASNTATGLTALGDNTTGSNNTADGADALFSNTTGGNNTAIGSQALQSNTTANGNTATGFQALLNNTTGGFNTANGMTALITNTIGFGNVATGFQALHDNTAGNANTAVGTSALQSNTTGGSNTAIGGGALSANVDGDSNTAIGIGALSLNTSGSENVALGEGAGMNVTTATKVICIGSDGANVNTSCFIGNIHGVTTATNDAIPVLIDSAGQLGTMNSSRRYKTDIRPIEKASESILRLRPVSFRYKVHQDANPQFGLIAEDVAQVNPDLVIYDADGKPHTVRYDAVNAMLLNEFLKEHRKVEEHEATIAQLRRDLQANVSTQQKQIEALGTDLQRISAQMQMNRTAPQVVATDR
jgi:hypothetical protein